MNTMPPIGSRVRYSRKVTRHLGPRTCDGVVMAHYPGHGERHTDPETGEEYVNEDHVAVKPDTKPEWWPYGTADRFAPAISELEPLK